jgi:hypothetical protein
MITLNKQEALDVFGLPFWNPTAVLEKWKKKWLFDIDNKALYQDLRLIITISKTYVNYFSTDLRYVLLSFFKETIHTIYKNETETKSLAELKFLFPIIFHFRNTTDLKIIKQYQSSNILVSDFKTGLCGFCNCERLNQ